MATEAQIAALAKARAAKTTAPASEPTGEEPTVVPTDPPADDKTTPPIVKEGDESTTEKNTQKKIDDAVSAAIEKFKPKPTTMEERFAENLKAQLGDNYPAKIAELPIETQIAVMESLIPTLGKKVIVDKGDSIVPGAPIVKEKALTTLQIQQAGKYRDKLNSRGSMLGRASKYFK